MQKLDVVIALETVRDARAKWAVAQTSFMADFEIVMKRLLNEAAVNFMSAEEVARASGLTVKRVRMMMRENNLNPKNGKRLLARTAAETLAENAALLGVEPREFDLTSPLAYLPMGSGLKAFLGNSVTGEEVEAEVAEPIDLGIREADCGCCSVVDGVALNQLIERARTAGIPIKDEKVFA